MEKKPSRKISLERKKSGMNSTRNSASVTFEDPVKPKSRATEAFKPSAQMYVTPQPAILRTMGEQLMRKDLHSDPFANKELELEEERKRKDKERKNADNLLFRESLRTNVIDQTKNRMKHTLGSVATEENVMYCVQPMLQLLEQQSKLVEESRNEIDGLQKILETKQLDIAKLSMENDKFLGLAGGRRDWKQYEILLAKERIVNRRLMAMFADQQNEKFMEEGRKNTYQEWIDEKAKLATGDHNGTVFPRRRLSPRY